MARDDIQTNIRLPADIRSWLQQQAERSRRTLTAELIIAIEAYRKQMEQRPDAQPR